MISTDEFTRKDSEMLEAAIWKRHLDENLIVCSFTYSENLFRYTGIMKKNDTWKPRVLKEREDLSMAFLRAKRSKNGRFAIALFRSTSDTEKFSSKGLLTSEQAFGSYVQCIEYVDGNPVIYNNKESEN